MGFAELLSGKTSPEQAIASSDTPGLSVMGSGQPPAHHAELLGSANLKVVMEKLSEQFDHIVLYGPPALLSADALAMAGQVEAILFVARAGKNSRGEINRMRQEMSRLNSHILGVVLNGVQATSGGYLRKSYQRFYDYQLGSTEQEAVQTTSDSQQQGPSPPEHS
jgi:receptor protein-tyrosine kinase